ncbi:hypothetical protein [Novispirillum itersonii]|uniref:hypothetical protein n=1 Tax=Novispirillum itersonii TaxID=189 RepID=UPI00036393C4|nr:hypothetical protein [Novispirillum itersonii]
MLRLILSTALPLLAPALFFMAWVWLRGRYVTRHGGQAPSVETTTWFWLAAAGLLLAALVLGVTALLEPGGTPGQEYRPPVVVDGKIVPGGFTPDRPVSGGDAPK